MGDDLLDLGVADNGPRGVEAHFDFGPVGHGIGFRVNGGARVGVDAVAGSEGLRGPPSSSGGQSGRLLLFEIGFKACRDPLACG